MIRFIVSCSATLFRVMPKAEPVYYAVKRGRVPGVYSTWSECESQVKGFPNPAFRKYTSYEAACEFSEQKATANSQPTAQENASFVFQVPKVPPAVSKPNLLDISQKPPSSLASNCCCQCSQNATDIASLSSTVDGMKSSIHNLVGVMEKLSKALIDVQSTVCRLEKTFMAPGSKRAFSTSTANANEARGKRSKFDINADCFTGTRFDECDGTHVYTDGGCFDNGRNGARAGIGVFWARSDHDNVSERLPGRPTNNRAEIHAAIRAVQIAKKKGIRNLILHTDSQFLINGITKWIRGWKRNQWKKTTGSPVINQKDFEELDSELKGMNVKWVYVRGHNGDPSNEEADLLARQGAAKLESSAEDTYN